MATTTTTRNIDDQLKAQLRMKAAMHGRSMEEEVRDILRAVWSVQPVHAATLIETIRARIVPFWDIELMVPRPGKGCTAR